MILKKSGTHAEFTETYTNKTVAQFTNWWKRMLFSGKGRMPKCFKTEEKLMNFITKTEGSIGYISKAVPVKNNLNVISIAK